MNVRRAFGCGLTEKSLENSLKAPKQLHHTVALRQLMVKMPYFNLLLLTYLLGCLKL